MWKSVPWANVKRPYCTLASIGRESEVGWPSRTAGTGLRKGSLSLVEGTKRMPVRVIERASRWSPPSLSQRSWETGWRTVAVRRSGAAPFTSCGVRFVGRHSPPTCPPGGLPLADSAGCRHELGGLSGWTVGGLRKRTLKLQFVYLHKLDL